MITWTRAELKTRAKAALKMYYWKMVLVAFILSMLMGASGGGRSPGNNLNSRRSGNSTGILSQTGQDDTQIKFRDGGEISLPPFSGGSPVNDAAHMPAEIKMILAVLSFVLLLVHIFLINPLIAGCKGFFDHIFAEDAEISEVLSVLRTNYWNGVLTCFLRDLQIFLWALLLVIPGIIKAYQFRMVPYILANNPDMNPSDVLSESKRMMGGHKWASFVLDLSFIGWLMLSIITVGLLYVFWVAPYMYATEGALYRKLSNTDYMSGNPGAGPYSEMPGQGGNPYGTPQDPPYQGANPYMASQNPSDQGENLSGSAKNPSTPDNNPYSFGSGATQDPAYQGGQNHSYGAAQDMSSKGASGTTLNGKPYHPSGGTTQSGYNRDYFSDDQ